MRGWGSEVAGHERLVDPREEVCNATLTASSAHPTFGDGSSSSPPAPPTPRTPPKATLGCELWQLAWPAILRNTLNCASDRITLAFVGHYDSIVAHYDGAGLGKMYSNITGLSVGFGVCLGLGTLCSQAHGAGRSAELNGLYLRQCMVLLAVAFVFSAGAALASESVLLALSQPAAVASCSSHYAIVQLVGVPFFWAANALQTVCDGLQDTKPGLHATLASSLSQVLLCAIALHPQLLDWGYLGMAASRSAGGVVQLVIIVGIIVRQRRQHLVWQRPTHARTVTAGAAADVGYVGGSTAERVMSLRGLWRFLVVALPGALIMWIEWWSFEGFSLIVGLLPDAEHLLAAHATMFNVLVVTYMSFTGLRTALCASTGRYIGRGLSGVVPILCALAISIAAPLSILLGSGLYVLRDPIAHLFTTDQGVEAAIRSNMLGAVLSVPGYGILMTLYGACQGANYQRLAFVGTLLGYAAGLPLAYYLGKVQQWPSPLLGVWLGNVAALAFAALWVVMLVVCKDWQSLSPVTGEKRTERLLTSEQRLAIATEEQSQSQDTIQ